jgi:hypothetical protein
MRALITILSIVIIQVSFAQVSITPYGGISIKRMKEVNDLSNGGSSLFGGIEIEAGMNRLESTVGVTLCTGISYLDIDYNHTSNLRVGDFYYWHESMSMNSRYFQVPLMLRINWRPSPLLEEWIVFFGAGVNANFLTSAHIAEEATVVTYQTGFPEPPPTIERYEDDRDISDVSKSMYLFRRIDIGMKMKRFYMAVRISKSLQDMFVQDLEGDWAVPVDQSIYLDGNREYGKISERYTELVFGYTWWPSKRVRQQLR